MVLFSATPLSTRCIKQHNDNISQHIRTVMWDSDTTRGRASPKGKSVNAPDALTRECLTTRKDV